ncbi:MAG: cytosine deaminase [Leptolyngbya sp. SIO4C1]|nr:cytosine deaminase [Leptolyngbya sp. SIO4C1]
MPSFFSPPQTAHYWLTNARIPACLLDESVNLLPITALQAFPHQEALVAVDLEIYDGAIRSLVAAGSALVKDVPTVNLRQGLIWPCFVDAHTHLDKGHIWPRTPNPDGQFDSALEVVGKDRERLWTAEDLYRRMEFGLKCSYAHGTQAIRTHLDAFGKQAEISFEVFRALQRDWADRIALQAVCLVSLDYLLTPAGEHLADIVAETPGGVLGGVAFSNPEIGAQIDQAFTLAQARDLDLDFHVDESLNPDDMNLRYVAEAKLRHGFERQVTCDHCCSLSVQSSEKAEQTLTLVKEADIAIISLPMCNLYLQDRHPGQMPQYRGVTLLHEIAQHEIPIAIASDNCRDPFFAYGDHDGLEVFSQSVRIGQLDRPYGQWPQAVTRTPAEMMGLSAGKIGLGQLADLVCFRARTLNELIARHQADRAVIRQGKLIEATLPDYAELDDLVDLVNHQ